MSGFVAAAYGEAAALYPGVIPAGQLSQRR
jgi:hypothetical protein